MLDQLQWARSGVPVIVARMPFLIVRSGPRAGERIELVAELVVGRENADVTVSDEEVSRRHLAVRPHEDGVELEDLGSTNGTFVDGARLSAVVVVSSSARVILGGETQFEIEVDEPEPEFDPDATRLRDRPPERDARSSARRRRARAPRRPSLGAPRPWPGRPPPGPSGRSRRRAPRALAAAPRRASGAPRGSSSS
jgi:hypothetical protein